MAERRKCVAVAKEVGVLDLKDFESAWIGRYRFSRSICHRLQTRVTPFLTGVERTQRSVDANAEVTAVYVNRSCPASPVLRPKLSRKSPSGPLSFRSSDRSYGSSSPSLNNSSSYLSFNSSTESSDEPIEEGRGNVVKRAVSWSQYFDGSGGDKAVEAPKHWMVDMSQLFLGQKFATGTYSRLYHGFYEEKEVAVKMMRPPDEDEEVAGRLERQFHHEVSLLSSLHHQNVVQFVAACRKPPVYCVITEYLSKGSLRSFLHRSGPGSLSLKVIVEMALDIARGMEYLHSQGIIHRDLKSENLCLDDDLRVKITDFGVSCHYTECDNLTKDTGTYRWMAPEMISHKHYTKKVDVYSFGIVLWELYTGLTPFEEMSAVQAAFAVVDKHARPVIPPDCPHVLSNIMKQCWFANPDKRPDFWEIVKRLEQFEDFTKEDISFSTWQYPSRRTNIFFRCFIG
ncbi:hypothetical protein O6H91_02G094200 [Diphasiastrum complanatum]|uniref:Uncharacterized protein n=1 Tax=Diphasiastrum complanatum TaxID=34168 RepID=A0ACC2EI51_DIPCM|nr:hypothetical protein O6H91_02G094200 [Diphasiastrum complanatum]